MKNMKKILALVLAVMMLAAMAVPAMAAGHGSITISNAMEGHTYTAYQLLKGEYDATSENLSNIEWGDDITDDGKTAIYDYFQLTGADRDLAHVLDALDGANDTVAIEMADAIGTAGVTGGTANGAADSTTYTISNLDDGYYMVVDTYTPAAGEQDVYYSRFMVQIVGEATVNVENKADKPSVEKDIDKDNNLSTANDRVDENTANIGDTVTYVITSAVPDMTGYREYYMTFSDTLSKGLNNAGNLAVSVNGTALTEYTGTGEKNAYGYTKTIGEYSATSGTTITVNLFDLVSRGYDQGDPIVITYTATVCDNAVIGNTGNPNTVTLTYSNDPKNSGDGTPDNPDEDVVTGITPPSEVKTFVTELELVKVDKDHTTTILPGAVFNVTATVINKVLITGKHFVEATTGGTHWLLNDGTYTDKAPTDATKSQYASETKKYKLEAYANESVEEEATEEFQVVTGDDGKIVLTGLKEGTYTFDEIQAPAGYNLLDENLTITITSNIDTKAANAAFAWEATGENVANKGDGSFTFSVGNGQGSTLPSTGGMGTTLLYIGGSVLVILAAVLLITKRRMSAND